MKLAALTLFGLGLIGAAQAQVKTNPVSEQRYLPVPDVLPELPFDTGLSPIDAVMFSQTMRGSVQDDSATPLSITELASEAPPAPAPALVSTLPAQPSPQTVAVQDPTILVPQTAATPEPGPAAEPEEPAEKPDAKAGEEKPAEKPKK